MTIIMIIDNWLQFLFVCFTCYIITLYLSTKLEAIEILLGNKPGKVNRTVKTKLKNDGQRLKMNNEEKLEKIGIENKV